MRTKFQLMIGVLFCAAFSAGCRRVESIQKPVKPVQVQEVRNYSPGGAEGGERYSANIMPSGQSELAFK